MKVAFVDHSYHRKTRSSDFFADILRRHGMDVTVLWDDSWQDGKAVELEALLGAYDAFVFWQIPARSSVPYARTGANITFVPMLDGYRVEDLANRRTFRPLFDGVKFFNFSRTMHRAVQAHGLESMHVPYFPDPSPLPADLPAELSGFFWQRLPGRLPWSTIEKLVGPADFRSVHIHLAADPPHSPLRPYGDGPASGRMTFSDWFADPADYRRCVAAAQVYFAPRPSEGIGMSFLEAMAMGRCVVAPNAPTMNEYIEHGRNGLLYDLDRPAPLDFSRAAELGRAARRRVEEGRAAWMARESEIAEFVARPASRSRTVGSRLGDGIREAWRRARS